MIVQVCVHEIHKYAEIPSYEVYGINNDKQQHQATMAITSKKRNKV